MYSCPQICNFITHKAITFFLRNVCPPLTGMVRSFLRRLTRFCSLISCCCPNPVSVIYGQKARQLPDQLWNVTATKSVYTWYMWKMWGQQTNGCPPFRFFWSMFFISKFSFIYIHARTRCPCQDIKSTTEGRTRIFCFVPQTLQGFPLNKIVCIVY